MATDFMYTVMKYYRERDELVIPNTSWPEAMLVLDKVYIYMGRIEEAIKYENAIRSIPHDPNPDDYMNVKLLEISGAMRYAHESMLLEARNRLVEIGKEEVLRCLALMPARMQEKIRLMFHVTKMWY